MPELLKQHDLLFKNESYRIIGAAMEVHKELKNGFLEPVYQEALEKELKLQNIPFERESLIHIYYKGEKLDKYYKADFVCYNEIIIELKALSDLTSAHESQLINYLKATNKKLGVLINFGKTSLQYKRIINTFH
ncbi:GxxExxY protein [Labilibacter marinus]|uniref:GxxExxY protein n=1 Tax=Labilibacter marinus TaxID=1477105 RepID=UPI00094F6967|nr:GxxExxY protein [Labilibacter marinus]